MVDPIPNQEQAIAEALLAEQETSGADVPHALSPPAPALVEFPRVMVNNRPLREITADIVQVLHTANTPPRLFVQAGQMVRLRQDERAQAWLEPVTDLHLRHRLSHIADVVHVTGEQGEHAWHVFPS